MLIYVLVSLLSIFVIYISYTRYGRVIIKCGNKSIRLADLLCIFIVLIFTIVMGIRADTVGIDTETYVRIHKKIAGAVSIPVAINQATFTGPLYIAVSWIITRFFKEPQIMLVLSSIIVNVGLYKFVKKASRNIPLSLFIWIGIGMFYFSMNGNRQTMATVINLNALYFLLEGKKYIKGWLLVLIAFGIHPSSIIMLLAFFSAYICTKINDVKTLFVVSAGAGVVVDIFFKHVLNILFIFLPGYAKYTTSLDGRATIFEETGGGRIGYLYIFLLLLCCFWCLRGYVKEGNLEHKFFPMLVFSLVFGLLNRRNVYVSRMLLYYLSTYTIYAPAMFNKIRNKRDNALVIIGFIVALFIYSILLLIENQNGIVPYSTWG